MEVNESQFGTEKERAPMLSKSSLRIVFLVGALMAIPAGNASPGALPQIIGVWDCQVIRPGSLSERPLLYTFHADGTTTFSSQSNISNLGFTSRGGAFGQYERSGPSDYHSTAVENLYKNGNAGGRFLIDNFLHLDKGGNRLCSGSVPGDSCPVDGNVRATKFQFPDASSACVLDAPLNLADPICGEVDLLNPPPGGNGVVNAVLRCDRINTLTTYGSSTPVFPIPDPVP
jgi:hypothetical protein